MLLHARPTSDALLGGLLELPGGKIRPFEAPACAASRELEEETRICVPSDRLEPVQISVHRYPDRSLRFYLYVYRANGPRHGLGRRITAAISETVPSGGNAGSHVPEIGSCDAIPGAREVALASGEWAFWPLAELGPAQMPEANRAWLPLLRTLA